MEVNAFSMESGLLLVGAQGTKTAPTQTPSVSYGSNHDADLLAPKKRKRSTFVDLFVGMSGQFSNHFLDDLRKLAFENDHYLVF